MCIYIYIRIYIYIYTHTIILKQIEYVIVKIIPILVMLGISIFYLLPDASIYKWIG